MPGREERRNGRVDFEERKTEREKERRMGGRAGRTIR